MIALETLDLFDPVLQALPKLAPPDALPQPGLPFAVETGFLSDALLPYDPNRLALIGVIDHAIPFAHPLFRGPEGHSRMAAIWLQDAPALDRRDDIGFGQEIRGRMLDALRPRDEDALYRHFGLMDPARGHGLLRGQSHGAGVACLAAGFAPDDPAALRHPILAVSLPDFGLADTSGSLCALFIQAAVVFVIARARALSRALSLHYGQTLRPPLVINLSLGITSGGRDGSSLITRLQEAIASTPEFDLGPVHFVLPMGNARQDRGRAVLQPGQSLLWHLPPDDRTPSAVEIWGQGGAGLPIELTLPHGESHRIDLPARGGLARLRDEKGREVAQISLQRRLSRHDAQRSCLTLIVPPTQPADPDGPTAPMGDWQIRWLGQGPAEVVVLRDDSLTGFARRGRQSWLTAADAPQPRRQPDGHWPQGDGDPPGLIRQAGTANSFAGGRHQIRVGATLARAMGADGPLSPYSGLLDDGQPGDVTAPADASLVTRGLIVPGLRAGQRQRLSGTSLAAPQMTRWLAGQLAAGRDLPDRAAIVAAVGESDCPDLPVAGGLPWRSGL